MSADTVHGDALDVDLAGGAHLERVPAASTGENSHAQQLVQIATLFAARLATTTAAARHWSDDPASFIPRPRRIAAAAVAARRTAFLPCSNPFEHVV